MRNADAVRYRRGAIALVLAVAGLVLSYCDAASASMLPVIQSEAATGVTATDATLEAEIAPGHWFSSSYDPEFDTGASYQFQLAESPDEFRPEVSCPVESPEAPHIGCIGALSHELYGGPPPAGPNERLPGDLPTDRIFGEGEVQSVSLDLASAGQQLKPETTYHYRVLVVLRVPSEDTIEWEAPPVYGADQTFTTPAVVQPPVGEPGAGVPTAGLLAPLTIQPLSPGAFSRHPKHRCRGRSHKRRATERLWRMHEAQRASYRCQR